MVNADTIPRYEQPMDPPEPTDLDWMDKCIHFKACDRAYRMHAYGNPSASDVASMLDCADCEEYEED